MIPGTLTVVGSDRIFNLPLFEGYLVIDPRPECEFLQGSVPTAVSWAPDVDGDGNAVWPSLKTWAEKHADEICWSLATPVVVLGWAGGIAELLAAMLRAGPSTEVQAYEPMSSEYDCVLHFLKRLHEGGREVWVLEGGAKTFQAAFPGLCRPGLELEPTPALIAPGVFLGSRAVPLREDYLKSVLGISDVLTSPDQAAAFQSVGLRVWIVAPFDFDSGNEISSTAMGEVWDAACDAIDRALEGGGTVLVAVHGRSRSASLVLAWLVRAHGLPVAFAATLMRSRSFMIDWTLLLLDKLVKWAEGRVTLTN